jgi:hypothetical protein
MIGLRQRALRFSLHQPPGISKFNTSAGTDKKRPAKLFFQRFNLHTQRGLYNIKTLRSPTKMPFFGHGKEITQMTEFHSFSYQSLKLIIQ